MSDQSLSIADVLCNFYKTTDQRFLDSVKEFTASNKDLNKEIVEQNIVSFLGKQLRQTASCIEALKEMKYDEAMEKLAEIKNNVSLVPREKDHDVPSFITQNIENMPQNRGYLWKGKTFHGKKPSRPGPKVLFEPRRKKTLIHVYEKGMHRVYEKLKGQRQQVLISETPTVSRKIQKKVFDKKEPQQQSVVKPQISRFAALYFSDSDSEN